MRKRLVVSQSVGRDPLWCDLVGCELEQIFKCLEMPVLSSVSRQIQLKSGEII